MMPQGVGRCDSSRSEILYYCVKLDGGLGDQSILFKYSRCNRRCL
jgi:hypothetical protein